LKIVVVDASALVEYLFRTDRSRQIEPTLEAADIDLHTPSLCDVEVAAAVRRGLLARKLTTARAEDAIEDYLDLPLYRHGHEALLGRVLELRSNFSAHDAAYVALAEQLGSELLTADDALAKAVRTHLRVPLTVA
jgi:predicted nucleic acid-binding protein